jgi:hypothetical protein
MAMAGRSALVAFSPAASIPARREGLRRSTGPGEHTGRGYARRVAVELGRRREGAVAVAAQCHSRRRTNEHGQRKCA